MTLHKFSFKMHWALGTTQEFQVLEGYSVSKRARLGVAGATAAFQLGQLCGGWGGWGGWGVGTDGDTVGGAMKGH